MGEKWNLEAGAASTSAPPGCSTGASESRLSSWRQEVLPNPMGIATHGGRRGEPWTVLGQSPSQEEKWIEMKRQIEWNTTMMEIQMRQKMYFMFEHPAEAQSWKLDCLRKVASRKDVYTIVVEGKRWMRCSQCPGCSHMTVSRSFPSSREHHND